MPENSRDVLITTPREARMTWRDGLIIAALAAGIAWLLVQLVEMVL